MDKNAKELSRAFSDFIKVDMTDDIKQVEESVDDTLTRLDEFGGLLERVKTETNYEVVESILACKPELFLLFERIQKLETIVSKVKENVDTVERLVVKAESDFNVTTEGKLKNFLKPILFKRNSVVGPQESTSKPTFTPPEIFSTRELFNKVDTS